MNKLLTGGIIALGIYALTAAKRAAASGKLEFYPNSVDFSDMTLTNWTFTVRIEVINPTKTKQNLNAIFGSVYAGSRKIAIIKQTTPQTIAKQESSFIDVPVRLTSDGAGYVLAKILKGDIPTITVKGTVDTMGVNIPFEEIIN